MFFYIWLFFKQLIFVDFYHLNLTFPLYQEIFLLRISFKLKSIKLDVLLKVYYLKIAQLFDI